MPTSFTDLSGLAGIALALAAGCALLLPRRISAALAAVALVALLLPFGDLPLAAYVRGMVGDLSISTLLLLGYAVARRAGVLPPTLNMARRNGALLLLVLAAVLLYPLALGAAPVDSYRWGYGDPWFLGLLLALALAGMALRLPLVALLIALAVLAWAVGWSESGNLWDYLIDPLLALYGIGALVAGLFRRRAT